MHGEIPHDREDTRIDVFRTPDERFAALPDYPFTPHRLEADGLRMHYLDEGAGDPGAHSPATLIDGASHFLQEDRPEDVTAAILGFTA